MMWSLFAEFRQQAGRARAKTTKNIDPSSAKWEGLAHDDKFVRRHRRRRRFIRAVFFFFFSSFSFWLSESESE